ncbi:uncharacterized protein LOC143199892 [Rhynchophorus ferrugineus]|uniref:uncharacterized protein LOC143199892 n=1 Tax=Rhynchophorus ferrugineus TaxID=354439 RepID=UPI003FCE4FFE
MEFRFDLDRSDYFNKRMELLRNNIVPKLSDAKFNFGDPTSHVIFQQCELALRADFGLKDPLCGPGDDLWISPSDLLIGKLALKPPFTPKCLQALTHQGILEIGKAIEDRFKQEMEEDKRQSLEKLRAELLATIDDRMRAEIKDAEIRERLNCQMEMEKRQLEFDLVLQDELDRLETTLRCEYEHHMLRNNEDLQREWEQRLKEEVEDTVQRMTAEFVKQLDKQQAKMTKIFEMELKHQEILREFDAKTAKMKNYEALRQLQHNLECTNLVNMMYVICTERKNCCKQKEQIEKNYKAQLADMNKTLRDRDEKIALLQEDKALQAREIALRERCLLEITRQFQKFVNFALRASPTQAEFLLSVEKMLVYELTDTVAKTDVSRLKPPQKMLSWIEPKAVEKDPSSLEIKDYHRCLSEITPPPPEEMGPKDDLPAVYFKNKLYIREDFRDMLSGGVELTRSNELWNHDVEILVDTWRKMSNDQITTALESQELWLNSNKETETLNRPSSYTSSMNTVRKSRQSQVKFVDKSCGSEHRDSINSRRLMRKSSLKPFTVLSTSEAVTEENTTIKESSNLLAARDSVELLVNKLKSSHEIAHIAQESVTHEITEEPGLLKPNGIDETGSKELGVETRDSVLLRKVSLGKKPSSMEFSVSPKDSIELVKDHQDTNDIRSRSSRLALARNSVELLRESMIKIHKDYPSCTKRDQATCSGTCFDQCSKKRSSLAGSVAKMPFPRMTSSVSKPMSVVSFQIEPDVVVQEEVTVKRSSKPQMKTRKTVKKTSSKPLYKIDIVGDKGGREGDENTEQFTSQRIYSLINLMKDHPNLLQLFTAGSR